MEPGTAPLGLNDLGPVHGGTGSLSQVPGGMYGAGMVLLSGSVNKVRSLSGWGWGQT